MGHVFGYIDGLSCFNTPIKNPMLKWHSIYIGESSGALKIYMVCNFTSSQNVTVREWQKPCHILHLPRIAIIYGTVVTHGLLHFAIMYHDMPWHTIYILATPGVLLSNFRKNPPKNTTKLGNSPSLLHFFWHFFETVRESLLVVYFTTTNRNVA